jgi:hypothetical protein
MKALFPLLIVLTGGYLGFVVWHNQQPAAVVQEAVPQTVVTVVATPTPIPVATVAPAPARNLAPPGTYFLIQRVSFMTDSGVIGDSPGTKVTMVAPGNPMKVTDGQNQFDVSASQVTNDLDIATRVFYADQNAQAQISRATGQEAAAFAKQQEADEKAWQAKVRSLPSTYAEPMRMDTGELDQGAHAVVPPDASGNYRGLIH